MQIKFSVGESTAQKDLGIANVSSLALCQKISRHNIKITIAKLDILNTIKNNREFEEYFERELIRIAKYQKGLVLIIFSIGSKLMKLSMQTNENMNKKLKKIKIKSVDKIAIT